MADIEYFYASYSAFAYLGAAKLMAVAEASGRTIVHKPMDLTRVIAAVDSVAFGERGRAHRAYYFRREIERWSEHRNAPVMDGRPSHHDNDFIFANCVLIATVQRGHSADRLAHAMQQAHWRDNADLADRPTLESIARSVDLDPAPLLEAAGTSDIQAIHEANTVEAIERSVFGSPTFFVDGDMFYGQDRLELVERALSKPFAGTWPKT